MNKEEMKLLIYEKLSNKYGWLPSEIEKEDADILEGYLYISALSKEVGNRDERELNGKT